MLRIILASQSPRRRQLLEQIGLEHFEVLAADADETYDPSLPPEKIVASISRQKAEAVRPLAEGALIITADTMVFMDGLRLGKPRSQEEAREMLSALSGRTHHVCTGVTVCLGSRVITEAETTDVTFRPLTGAAWLGDRQLCTHRRAHGQGGILRRPGFRRSLRGAYRRRLFQRHGPPPLPPGQDAGEIRR